MRIALDARTIYSSARRGTGKNLIDLYRHLSRLRPQWQFELFHQLPATDNPFDGLANVRSRRVGMPGDRWNLWQQVRLPLAARQADVLHCPANTAPYLPATAMVVTIHDLIPLEGAPTPQSRRWERNVRHAARAARRIITPSEFSKGQIASRLDVPPEKIAVNPWAADESCRRVEDPAVVAAALGQLGFASGRPYVFGFGASDPRKNTERILHAWSQLPRSLRGQYTLLLVGIAEPARTAFRRLAEQLGIAAECSLNGFVEERYISALLTGASLLCYPSLSEGFGLPILDAFACETPVLTSNTTSLPEVAGPAGLLVDPADEHFIAQGLSDLLESSARREDLVKQGRARLPKFTWEACAQRACRVFEEAANA